MIYGYCRISTEHQVVSNQKHGIQTFADDNNLQIDKWVEETISSRKHLSELSLGFWVYLFLPAYNDVIWKKHPQILQEIFDGCKDISVLSRIFNKLNRIRMYRNKIFHYGSLLVVAEENRPEKVHNLIYRMVGDLNAPSTRF